MKKVIAAVLFIGMAGQANAALYNAGSTGSFSFGGATWDTSFTPTGNNDGSIRTGPEANSDPLKAPIALGEVQITGSDTGTQLDIPVRSLTTMTTTIAQGGTISVDWTYTSGILDPAENDPFIWLLDGMVQLPFIYGADTTGVETGTFTTVVDAGALFGLSIASDNLFGAPLFQANVVLSNFTLTDLNGSNLVPVPPAFLLFGTALAGLGFFRKKKAAV